MPEHVTFRWLVKALTPPIVVIGVKGLLRRLGLLAPPVAEATPEPVVEAAEPEFEVVPTGWEGVAGGWDEGAVADAYVAKWPEWVAALKARGRSGSTTRHERASRSPGTTSPRTTCSSRLRTCSPGPQADANGSRCSTGAAGWATTPSSPARSSRGRRSTGTAARCRRSRPRERGRTRT